MTKTIDFNRAKSKKIGEVTPREIIDEVANEIESEEIDKIVIIRQYANGSLMSSWSTNSIEAIGLLETGKVMIIDEMKN